MNHKNLLGITAQKKILDSTIKLAGDRYNDDLNIPTLDPIGKMNIAAHDDAYKESIAAIYNDILALANRSSIKTIAEENISIILDGVSNFVDKYPLVTFDWKDYRSAIVRAQDVCYEKLRELNNTNRQHDITERTYVRNLTNQLTHLNDLISEECQDLYNHRLAILYGEGGIGKTHLLCDYAKQRLESSLPTIILLSDDLANKDPILAIARRLRFRSRKLFLEELKTVADQYGQVCIIVDAINENPVIKWKKLAEILAIPSVSILLSIRSGFETTVGINDWKIPRIEHRGFAETNLEWEAMQKYFHHYKLQDIADTPILYTEFRNPLFLKIFCESYSGTKSRKKPRGNIMTNVFEQYIVNKTKIISKDLGIEIEKKNIWNNIVKEIAETMGHKGIRSTVSHRKLCQIIKNTGVAPVGRTIDLLCNNGILRKIPHYTKRYRRLGYDYEFAYHKFSDHIIVRYFLNSFNDACTISKSRLLQNALKQWNTGLIEALAIQYPERHNGCELIEIIPTQYKFTRTVWSAILNSIVWRSSKSFNEDEIETLKQYVIDCNREEGILLDYLDRLISVAIIPEHPFNSLELHRILLRNSMPNRDAWWQEYTCYSGSDGDSFDRLCSWVFSQFSVNASEEQKLLAIIALSWFLASTDRGVRDRASYAILRLSRADLAIILKILDKFQDCDDQYILERLYLIAYGAAIYSRNNKAIFKKLVNFIDRTIFQDKSRIPNIIIDQCAKDIIALYQSRYGDADDSIVLRSMPPYTYHNPFKRLPSVKTIMDKYGQEAAKNDCRTTIGSVMYPDAWIADFGNYIMGSCFHNLSSVPISEPIPKIVRQYNAFLSSLTPMQDKLLWDYYCVLRRSIPSKMPRLKLTGNIGDKITIEQDIYPAITTKLDVAAAKEAFAITLSRSQWERLAEVSNYIFANENPNMRYIDRRYDLSWARRWIFKNVLRLGWTYSLHGRIDATRYQYGYMRGGSSIARVERIGKKHQWISLHQLMALASSQYYLMDSYGNHRLEEYANSLEFNDRTFDPTVPPNWIIDNNGRLASNDNKNPQQNDHLAWWKPDYRISPEDRWLFSTHDIPTIEQLVCIQHNSNEYFALQNWPTWKKYYDNKTKWRELWIQVSSYIIKLDDIPKVSQLCQSGTFNPMKWELPDLELYNNLYLGEILYNTPVFSPNFEGITELSPSDKNHPFSAVATTLEYDGGSFELGPVMQKRIQMPSPFLRKQLGLTVNEHMSFTNNDDLEIFCPAINLDSSFGVNQYILVTNKNIIDHLHKCGYTIIWTAIGEKREFNDLPPNRDSICLRGCMYMDEKKRIIKKVRFSKISDEYKKRIN